MDNVANFTEKERMQLFSETAKQKGMSMAIVEKDFWVTWTLGKIFDNQYLSRYLMFKGGTTLSKVFNLIERFSEDIDLILDWRLVTEEDPNASRSKTKQDKFNKQINQNAQDFIKNKLLFEISRVIKPQCRARISDYDSHVIEITYPKSFVDEYIRPTIILEIGPLAAWVPYGEYHIESYAAELFPQVFNVLKCNVKAIKAERTFWEKATILHTEANRPEDKKKPQRYSRHYYDLFRMHKSVYKEQALKDLSLLKSVIEFKKKFYPLSWAQYENAVPGSFKLIPPESNIENLNKDYQFMRTMIYGDYPSFENILMTLQDLEGEINKLPEID